MTTIDYGRWGITYLVTDSSLSMQDREELLMYATVMYLNRDKIKEVKGDNYEGVLETEGEHQMLGNFGGQRFSARLETNHGKSRVDFLVTERVNPNLN